MTKQITALYQVEDGKQYFIMKLKDGQVMTAICRAEVKTKGTPIVYAMDIMFETISGDLPPGPMNEYDYIAEIDD